MATQEKERILVIVFGLPGSGKSYFAGALAEEIGYHYLNSDVIRKEMHKTRQYSGEDKASVYQEMYDRTKELLKNGSPVVVDATFYLETHRSQFNTLWGGEAEKLFFIEIKADEEIIKERLQQKRDHSEADFEVYEKVRDQFEEMHQQHLVLISGRNNLNQMLTKARSYLSRANEAI